MDVLALCPLRVASTAWRRADGDWAQTIVCRATFDLVPDEARLAEVQEPPTERDEHWDDDPSRSLYAPSDLAPLKPRADVLLVGHAFAPGSEAVPSLVARLVVGAVDKRVEVHCDRAWTEEGSPVEGPWFTSMPLTYERAAGGPGTWNPVGVSPGGRPDLDGLVRLPNLQPPGLRPKGPGAHLPPLGFGPIAPGWPDRVKKAAKVAGWPEEGWQERPLPEALDPGYFNVAPADQRLETIRDDERLVLENLSRQHARLVTALPGLRPRVRSEAADGAREIPMRADTLWIDTDRALCTVTWRGVVALERAAEPGRVLVAMERRGRPFSWSEVERKASRIDPDATQPMRVTHFGPTVAEVGGETQQVRALMPALPFRRPQDSAVLGPEPVRAPGVGAAPPPPGVAPAPPAPVSPPTPAAPSAALAAARGLDRPPARLSVGQAAVLVGEAPSMTREPRGPEPARPALAPSVAPPPARPASRIGPWIPPGSAASAAAADAVPGSALAASNGAAGLVLPTGTRSAAPAEGAAARPSGDDVVELLWLDPAVVPRLRRHRLWKPLLAQARPRAIDEDDGEPRKEAKERREALSILRHGEALATAGLQAELAASMQGGVFAPSLVLVDGALEFPFDEMETLKATLALLAPFTPGDKKLKEVSDPIGALLESPWLQKGTSGLERFTARLREAFAQGSRGLPAGYLEAHTERLLLEQRRYEKRTLLGQPWIRARFTPSGGGDALPAYLPESLTRELPMFQRFRARLVAELRLQLDQYEASPSALRVVVLGRVMSPPRRRSPGD